MPHECGIASQARSRREGVDEHTACKWGDGVRERLSAVMERDREILERLVR
jgi:hypothetical protein